MDMREFRYRQQIRDRFAVAIQQAKKQVVIDEQNLLKEESAEPVETPEPAAE
jgi:hypothetical protein